MFLPKFDNVSSRMFKALSIHLGDGENQSSGKDPIIKLRVLISNCGVSEFEHIKTKGEQLLKSDLTDLAPDY